MLWTMARKLLLSVMLLMFLQETRGEGKPSSCSIPPVEDGGTAVLTCNFDANIYETKDSFQVDRYSTAKSKEETLLACQWISDKLECHLHASVRFDRNITNTFQVEIHFVTSDDFGEYVCYVLPIPNGISKRCYLTRIDINMTTDHQLNDDATLMPTAKSIQGRPKSKPLTIGGNNGTRVLNWFSEQEEFLTTFQMKGHPTPHISSIQVTGTSKEHYTLKEYVVWTQVIFPNVPEPSMTTILLVIMRPPMGLFNYYDMNVTNSEGTTTVPFQIKSVVCAETPKECGQGLIACSLLLVLCVIAIVGQIVYSVHVRRKRKRDSSKSSHRYNAHYQDLHLPSEVDHYENPLQH